MQNLLYKKKRFILKIPKKERQSFKSSIQILFLKVSNFKLAKKEKVLVDKLFEQEDTKDNIEDNVFKKKSDIEHFNQYF